MGDCCEDGKEGLGVSENMNLLCCKNFHGSTATLLEKFERIY